MTTTHTRDDAETGVTSSKLSENLARLEELSARLTNVMSKRRPRDPALDGPSGEFYIKAANAYLTSFIADPGRLLEQQVNYWGKSLKHYVDAQQSFVQGLFKAPTDTFPKDRRFSNPLWQSHPYFNFIKQQYQLNAEAVTTAVDSLTTLEEKDQRNLRYFTNFIIDMLAPTNFLATNPDALERAVETEGESLVRGLENLVRDLEANDGDLLVTLSDPEAFDVGKDLAATPGDVIYKNHLFELIHYHPTTEKVHQTPILIFPPWINKFYIIDLKPDNSLVKWIVDQGYSLFVVSWVNPDPAMAHIGMDDYIHDGFIRAIAETRRFTQQPHLHAVGYCIAGTTLSLTLAHLAKTGDTSVKSATFFTTLTDFTDKGEVGVFLNDDFLSGLERQMAQDGILDRRYMQKAFSCLRANDLIYGPAIKSYMLGEVPPVFDLLHWNGDATNLPAKMASQYLRQICSENRFTNNTYQVFDSTVKISDIKVPLCAIACESDHIANWRSSFNGISQMGSSQKNFILAQSGHIAGIINPPSRHKYGYWSSKTGDNILSDDWQTQANYTKGSWWPAWVSWLSQFKDEMIFPVTPDVTNQVSLGPAPGEYVRLQAPKVEVTALMSTAEETLALEANILQPA